MTIEQKINKYLEENPPLTNNVETWSQIEDWTWYRIPYFKNYIYYNTAIKNMKEVCEHMNNIIDKADIAECLTSKSHYIREHKKWLMKGNKNEK